MLLANRERPANNRWQNQQIKKKFKNRPKNDLSVGERQHRRAHGRSSNAVWQWDSKNSRTQRCLTMLQHKSLCFTTRKQYHNHNHTNSTRETEHNVIPVWQCPRCTYINAERGAFCLCGHAYQTVHPKSKSTNSVEISDDECDPCHTITLNDFLPIEWQQTETYASTTPSESSPSASYSADYFVDYDEDIQWIDFSCSTPTTTTTHKQSAKSAKMKEELMEAIEFGEFGVVSGNAKQKIEKYEILQQSVRKLRVIPDGIATMRCLMSDFWLSMIEKKLLNSEFQFVFTRDVEPWKERKCPSDDNWNYVNKMREIIHHDELYRMCGFKALLGGVLQKARASIPADISEMILCFLGLYEKFLPFATNTFSHSDPCNYYAQRQRKINCKDLMIDFYSNSVIHPRTSKEVFVCLTMNTATTGEIAYNELIPILSVRSDVKQPRQRYYKRRARKNGARGTCLPPWMQTLHGKPEMIYFSPKTWKAEILDRPVYGDRTRYTRRKWSAFHKMNNSS